MVCSYLLHDHDIHGNVFITAFFSAGLVHPSLTTMADGIATFSLSPEAKVLWDRAVDLNAKSHLCPRCEQPYNLDGEVKVTICTFTGWCTTCVRKYGEEMRSESCTCSEMHEVSFSSSVDYLPKIKINIYT